MAAETAAAGRNETCEGMSTDDHAIQQSPSISVRAEWLAYLALALVSLFIRVAALDSVPLNGYEATQSLQAWHSVEDDAPGDFVTSQNPLTYTFQLLTFSTLGASAFTARIAVALAGVALSLCPLLFRENLGATRVFIWSVLLTVLTVPVAAARTADGTTFMMLFTVLAIWMIRRFWYSQELPQAVAAIAFITFMLALSGPSGIPLFVILLVSGWLAVWRTALSAPQRMDLPGDDILQLSLKRLQDFPYTRVAFAPLSIVFIVGTLFMLNPAGLQTIAESINVSLTGFSQGRDADGMRLGIIALLTYEPLLIVFALGGAWLIWKHGAVSYIDRFAAAWVMVATAGLFLYPGARPADAMWVVLPLSLLASYGITQLMINRRMVVLWADQDDDDGDDSHELYTTHYWWVKWAISLGVLLLLLTAAVQFLQVGRSLLDVPADTSASQLLERLSVSSYTRLAQGLGLLAMTAAVAVVLYLILANTWGSGTCLQGIGIGFFWFMILSGLGGAWQIAVADTSNPAEYWHPGAISGDSRLLRKTLFELAEREAKGFPVLEVTTVTDTNGVVDDKGLMGWLMRDFPKARFVNSAAIAAGEPIIIMAQGEEAFVDLQGNYVGQKFVLQRRTSPAGLDPWQLPSWWSQRRLRRGETGAEEAVILWLRQDVYDNVKSN
ncbi:MAG: hypothetical protein OXN94_05165 [Chloroflexota bacterium]|nr:hypothetical protein [Chloroflexota bacterium]